MRPLQRALNSRRPVTQAKVQRSGAAAVEAAIVLSVLLVLVFGIFDFGMAAARRNCLSECARRAGRLAIISGEKCPSSRRLGPTDWTGRANASHPIATAIRPFLMAMPAADVQVHASWLDGGNRMGQRVRIDLQYQQTPLVPIYGSMAAWNLTASSTMRVVH